MHQLSAAGQERLGVGGCHPCAGVCPGVSGAAGRASLLREAAGDVSLGQEECDLKIIDQGELKGGS